LGLADPGLHAGVHNNQQRQQDRQYHAFSPRIALPETSCWCIYSNWLRCESIKFYFVKPGCVYMFVGVWFHLCVHTAVKDPKCTPPLKSWQPKVDDDKKLLGTNIRSVKSCFDG
jgi:hypothetical protein